MLTHAVGEVTALGQQRTGAQEMTVRVAGEGERAALCYPALTGAAQVGDTVLLNTTARTLKLGTGGVDFVQANLSAAQDGRGDWEWPPRPNSGGPEGNSLAGVWEQEASSPAPQNWPSSQGLQSGQKGGGATPDPQHGRDGGHIIKARYLPCQYAVLTLEEQAEYADVWDRTLDGLPVLVGQLHSQIAPAAAGLRLNGKQRVAYVMLDGAALMAGFSRLIGQLKDANLLHAIITCGQASGGDWETVTLHSALLAAKHILACDAAIVCQGPGNAGTGTKYGFSGIDQAQNLDIVKALEGMPIAIVRMSGADPRPRHQGVSHHTRTSLDMAYARCLVPVPEGADTSSLPPGHDVREVGGTQAALDLLESLNIHVTTMGRTPAQDPTFFHAAAAAGLAA